MMPRSSHRYVISTVHIVNALVGARMAIRDSLPQSPGTARTGGRLPAVFGVGYRVRQLAEPLARSAIAHPAAKPARTAIVFRNVVLPATMAALAFRNRR